MLSPLPIPSLFITGTDTGIGKTVVAGAIANWFSRRGYRTGVCKPMATGCPMQREGLVSEDAEFLATSANSRHALDIICPQRFAEPLAPSIASERAHRPIEWELIDKSLQFMCRESDVMIVEGVGGVMVPLDTRHTVLDLATWLRVPAVVVARPGLGTINHTLLTVSALRNAGVEVAGVVVNRYPTDLVGVAEETNPRAIEKWGKVRVLCVVPDEKFASPEIPTGIVSAINQVDWMQFASCKKS